MVWCLCANSTQANSRICILIFLISSLLSPPPPPTLHPALLPSNPCSELFLKRITKVPVKTVMLEKAGHYPLEQPGIDQLHAAIAAFIKDTVLAAQ